MSKRPYVRPLDFKQGRVEMNHGAGGRAMAQLIEQLFLAELGNDWLRQGHDATTLPRPAGRLVLTTDAHVVSPLFFPGGDIGSLAVHGTINDVAMAGAMPLYLTASFILEEGLPLADLRRIVQSMAAAATAAGVPVVTGDTKVVERGKGDGVFISCTGVGVVADGLHIGGERARPGDAILLSGAIGEHGMAIMSQRENLEFDSPIVSDSQPLHRLVAAMLASGGELHVLRDPTRGGVASTLNEIAAQSGVGMLLDEASIPVPPAVAAACEFLGLDPLNVANEGKLLALCPAADADRLLSAMRACPEGAGAVRIGEVVADEHGFVQMTTRLGGRRLVDWLSGEALPRIC